MNRLRITAESRLTSSVLCCLFWLCYVSFYSGIANGILFVGALAIFFAILALLDGEFREKKDAVVFAGAKKRDFDWGMHYFRGIAIVIVVLGHLTLDVGRPSIQKAFLVGSTVPFLFISGYLCQFLALRRPTTALVYYKKKFLNVILPYIVCSLFTLLLLHVCAVPKIRCFDPTGATIREIAVMFLYGQAQAPYWYIPFVSVLFLISPLVLKLSNSKLIFVTICAFMLAILFPTRGYPFNLVWPNVFYLYSYFTVSYLFGFAYCRFRELMDSVIKPLSPFFACLVFVIGVWMLRPSFGGIRLVDGYLASNVQKWALVFVMIAVLNTVASTKIAWLDALAKYSFTIFFSHRLFIDDLVRIRASFSTFSHFWGGGRRLYPLMFFCILPFLFFYSGSHMFTKEP